MFYNYVDGYYCRGYDVFGGLYFIIPMLIVGLIIYAVIKLLSNNNNTFIKNDPLNELKNKFVNGELSEEDYNRKKQILKK